MTVYYEWDCEEVSDIDQEGYAKDDVIQHNHSPTYKEALATSRMTPPEGSRWDIVLVRDDDNTRTGDRTWAYMHDGENGTLPEYFCDANGADARKVPKRFFEEVARAHKED